jgi:hypothetical protein
MVVLGKTAGNLSDWNLTISQKNLTISQQEREKSKIQNLTISPKCLDFVSVDKSYQLHSDFSLNGRSLSLIRFVDEYLMKFN